MCVCECLCECMCVCDRMGKGKAQIKIQDLPFSMTFPGILNTRGLQKFHRKMCVLKRPDIDIKLFWHLNELIFWLIFPQTSCNTLVFSNSSVFLMTAVLAFAVFISCGLSHSAPARLALWCSGWGCYLGSQLPILDSWFESQLVLSLSSPLFLVPEKAVESGSSAKTPGTCMGDPGGLPGAWFELSPALVTVDTWGVNQHMEWLHLSVSLAVSLCFWNDKGSLF